MVINTTMQKIIPVICALFLIVGCSTSKNSPPPPSPVGAVTISDPASYLVQMRCTDGHLAVDEDGCDAKPQTASDPMLERRHDWPAPTGYQISDSFVYDDGSTYETTWSYPPFGSANIAAGDGGEVYKIDGSTVRISATQDGGKTFLQGFYGASCGGTGWVLFRTDAPTGSWASVVAVLDDYAVPSPCKAATQQYTQYRMENVTIPFIINNQIVQKTLPTIISEHYTATSIGKAAGMERSFMAQGVGRVIWESWTKTPPASDISGRCPGTAWSVAPAPGWYFSDCRYSTNIQPADGLLTGNSFAWPPVGSALP